MKNDTSGAELSEADRALIERMTIDLGYMPDVIPIDGSFMARLLAAAREEGRWWSLEQSQKADRLLEVVAAERNAAQIALAAPAPEGVKVGDGERLRIARIVRNACTFSEEYRDKAVEAATHAILASPPPGEGVNGELLAGRLAALRSAGWSVAVHNDYRQGGEPFTFWLFTNAAGRAIKGEGRTDAEALAQCLARAEALPSPPGQEIQGLSSARDHAPSTSAATPQERAKGGA